MHLKLAGFNCAQRFGEKHMVQGTPALMQPDLLHEETRQALEVDYLMDAWTVDLISWFIYSHCDHFPWTNLRLDTCLSSLASCMTRWTDGRCLSNSATWSRSRSCRCSGLLIS